MADNASDPTPPTTSTAVESISLDKSELTLSRLETYTLKTTINPDNATNQKVSWTSSDDKIAKVDADGKVTALAVGKATINSTTQIPVNTGIYLVKLGTGSEAVVTKVSVH